MIFDGGLFFLMLGLAITFLVVSIKFETMFLLLSGIIFIILAIIMFASYDVAFVTTVTDGTNDINQTNYIIGDGTTETESNSSWLGWIFMLIGLMMFILFFFGMMTSGGS